MPRIRGHLAELPTGPDAWALLNDALFGSNEIGGQSVAVRGEALPWDWSMVFGRTAPLHLEIGFNRGEFLRTLAAQSPESDFVGVEIRRRFCWRLTHLIGDDDAAPRNLRIVWADAKIFCPVVFAPGSLAGIYITFPDPWWKKRHFKRRLVDTPFVKEMASLLAVGGRVWVKSDVPAVADEIAQSFASSGLFCAPTPFDGDRLPFTHREVNCIDRGVPIRRFYATRRGPES